MGRFINADGLVSTGEGLLGNNMFAYCNNNPVTNSDPTGEVLIGAMIGGAIGGALISAISHIRTNPDATFGSTLGAIAIGAVTGAIGGWAGVASAGKGLLSIGAGVVAGVYAGATASGSNGQKILTGITTGIITAGATYCGSKIDTSGFDRFGTAAANYATTIFVGSVSEPVTIHIQPQIAKPIQTDYQSTYYSSSSKGSNPFSNRVHQFA